MENQEKIKVALYARVSLDEKADDRRYQEPENQLLPLRDYARALNYEIVKEYVDKASGANPARPAFRQMMSDAVMRKFGGILVWKLDRFSREGVGNTLAYIKKLKNRKVFLKSLTESWLDTQDEGMAELVLAIMAWASAEERRKISERTKGAIRRLKAIGQWKGGRPRTTPPISEVCIKREDGLWHCLNCNRPFRDENYYLRKWNAHRRYFGCFKEKGGKDYHPKKSNGWEGGV